MVNKLAVTLACVLAGPIVAELGFRLLEGPLDVERQNLRDFRSLLCDGTLPRYEARAHVVFARPRGTGQYNSAGFDDREWELAKTPGVPRILCLGASTPEGREPARYPHQLEQLLERRTGRDFEVMSAAVSGWNSAEMLVSWFLTLQDYAPDVLVIHEGVADLHPRFRKDFRADYSHWRVPLTQPPTNWLTRRLARWSDLYLYQRLCSDGLPDIGLLTSSSGRADEPLVPEGRLPPETARSFVRNVASVAASARDLGATVVFLSLPTRTQEGVGAVWDYGVAENNRNLAQLAAEQGFLFVDAAGWFREHPEVGERVFVDSVHVTDEGDAHKAELVADVLEREWLPALSANGASATR